MPQTSRTSITNRRTPLPLNLAGLTDILDAQLTVQQCEDDESYDDP